MPDQAFHVRKRDGFSNSGNHLQLNGPPDSGDAAVQDFFYAALHEVERFLSLFGAHSGHHRRRKELIIDQKIIKRRGRVFIGYPSDYRTVTQVERTVENVAEVSYLSLYAMRQLKVYGSLPGGRSIPRAVGGRRFANALDINTARRWFQNLAGSLARHEHSLGRRGLL